VNIGLCPSQLPIYQTTTSKKRTYHDLKQG
jgi:SNF2 family DNA or RNA helicase